MSALFCALSLLRNGGRWDLVLGQKEREREWHFWLIRWKRSGVSVYRCRILGSSRGNFGKDSHFVCVPPIMPDLGDVIGSVRERGRGEKNRRELLFAARWHERRVKWILFLTYFVWANHGLVAGFFRRLLCVLIPVWSRFLLLKIIRLIVIACNKLPSLLYWAS